MSVVIEVQWLLQLLLLPSVAVDMMHYVCASIVVRVCHMADNCSLLLRVGWVGVRMQTSSFDDNDEEKTLTRMTTKAVVAGVIWNAKRGST